MSVRNTRRRRPSKSTTPNKKIALFCGFYLNLSACQVQVHFILTFLEKPYTAENSLFCVVLVDALSKICGDAFDFDPPGCQVPDVRGFATPATADPLVRPRFLQNPP